MVRIMRMRSQSVLVGMVFASGNVSYDLIDRGVASL